MFEPKQVLEIVCKFFRQFSLWIVTGVFIIGICIGTTLVVDYLRRIDMLKKSELESKLLWNAIGQCYYVELDEMNKYHKIIRVKDCDKTK